MRATRGDSNTRGTSAGDRYMLYRTGSGGGSFNGGSNGGPPDSANMAYEIKHGPPTWVWASLGARAKVDSDELQSAPSTSRKGGLLIGSSLKWP